MDNTMTAKVLKKLIDDKGITYAFISRKTGISADAISKSLRCKRRLNLVELNAICHVANINVFDLLEAVAASW